MELDFKRAVLMYKDMVYKIACVGCKNAADADDIFQDVFFTLSCRKKPFENDEHLKAWLIRVTVNRVNTALRSLRVRRHTPLEETLACDGTHSSPAEQAELGEIREAVLSLPEKYRIAVILHYYSGFECHEIGEMLGISEAAVKTRLCRARGVLKNRLKEDVCYDQ